MESKYLLALALALVPLNAHAITRLNSESVTCARIQAVIRSEGAAILRFSSKRVPGLPLYDRYVAHGGYCGYGEFAKRVSVPSRDTPSCSVFKCQQKTYDYGFFHRFD